MNFAGACAVAVFIWLGVQDWGLEEKREWEERRAAFSASWDQENTSTFWKGQGNSSKRLNQAIPGVFLPPKHDSLEEQFEFAKSKLKDIQQVGSGQKWRKLQEAAGALNAVSAYWPQVGAMQTEACYRLGEVLLQLEDSGGAFGAFQMVLDAGHSATEVVLAAGQVPTQVVKNAGHGSTFMARARMQLGHIHRRSGRASAAVAEYQRAAKEPLATLRQKNDALEWLGKTWMSLGDWTMAEQAFRNWALRSEGPLERIRATDLQAQVFIQSQNRLAADILLSTLRENLRALSFEATAEGRKVYAALGKMRADQQLRSIRRFGEGHGDG